MKRVIFCAAVLLMAGPARADKLVLNDGRELEGIVIFEGDQVILTNRAMEMRFQAADVKEHRICPTREELYIEHYRATDFNDADSVLSLVLWAENNNAGKTVLDHLYIKQLQIDPNCERAHERLGHIRHNLQWYTEREYADLTGLVKCDGEWISREAAEERQRLSVDEEALAKEQQHLRELFDLLGSEDKQMRDVAFDTIKQEYESKYPGISQLAKKTITHQEHHREYIEQLKRMERAAGLEGRGPSGLTQAPRDAGIVNLGGSTTATVSDSKSTVPFLGSIPGIAPLFTRKGRTRNYSTTNIYARTQIIDLEEARLRQQGR